MGLLFNSTLAFIPSDLHFKGKFARVGDAVTQIWGEEGGCGGELCSSNWLMCF